MYVVKRQSRIWLKRFEDEGIDGLEEKPRSGREPKISPEEEELVKQSVERSPKNPLKAFLGSGGTEVSKSTFNRILNRLGFSWKRERKALWEMRDEDTFRRAQEELEDLKKQAKDEEILLYFMDESGFSLNSSVPYSWQETGHTTSIPSGNSHQKRANVIGFLNYNGEELHSHIFHDTINESVVEYVLDDFASKLKSTDKPTVVIFDNASIHHTDEVESALERLEKTHNIKAKFLPAYSPELNYIEILWKRIKHQWLSSCSYKSFQTLEENLIDILSNYGSNDEYKICFS